MTNGNFEVGLVKTTCLVVERQDCRSSTDRD